MLDINAFRVDKGGNPQLIKDSQKKRGESEQLVDDIIALDAEWVVCNTKLQHNAV